jgi:hypothetical protein
MMASQVPTETAGKVLSYVHPIALNDNVQVNLVRTEYQIANGSTNKKGSSASCYGHLPAAMQPVSLFGVQFVEQSAHCLLMPVDGIDRKPVGVVLG